MNNLSLVRAVISDIRRLNSINIKCDLDLKFVNSSYMNIIVFLDNQVTSNNLSLYVHNKLVRLINKQLSTELI